MSKFSSDRWMTIWLTIASLACGPILAATYLWRVGAL